MSGELRPQGLHSPANSPILGAFTPVWRVQLVKTPNFKQEKKQREMAQKKKNEQKQQQKAARKGGTPDPQPQ